MNPFFSGLAAVVLLVASSSAMAGKGQCHAAAIKQAKALLNFHVGGDDRIAIEDVVKELPSISNPAAPQQRFKVLEVWGTIYKGSYRMHLIYYPIENECVLMGQEVLEFARL